MSGIVVEYQHVSEEWPEPLRVTVPKVPRAGFRIDLPGMPERRFAVHCVHWVEEPGKDPWARVLVCDSVEYNRLAMLHDGDREGLLDRLDRRAAYQLGPQPEGTVRVVLNAGDYDLPAKFSVLGTTVAWPYYLHDIPREQLDRWMSVMEAFAGVQDEISSLIDARIAEAWKQA